MQLKTKELVHNLITERLNLNWFEKAFDLYLKNEFYNAREYCIYSPNPISFELDTTGSEPIPHLTLEVIGLGEWSWIVIGLKEYQEELMFDPGNLEPMISVWYYLSFKIDSVFNENIDIPTKYKYLEKVIEYIEVEILNLKSNSSNKFYHMILDYFFEKIEGAFRDKYALVYELFSSTETYDDKVKFNLTQEQLAAFTYLIANSGMLNNEITKEKFYYFCERHFYYLSRDGKTYKPLQQAAKKATKRYDGKEPPVKVVFDKIESVYDENLTK